MTTDEILREINTNHTDSIHSLVSNGFYYSLIYDSENYYGTKIKANLKINNQSLEEMIKWVKENEFNS